MCQPQPVWDTCACSGLPCFNISLAILSVLSLCQCVPSNLTSSHYLRDILPSHRLHNLLVMPPQILNTILKGRRERASLLHTLPARCTCLLLCPIILPLNIVLQAYTCGGADAPPVLQAAGTLFSFLPSLSPAAPLMPTLLRAEEGLGRSCRRRGRAVRCQPPFLDVISMPYLRSIARLQLRHPFSIVLVLLRFFLRTPKLRARMAGEGRTQAAGRTGGMGRRRTVSRRAAFLGLTDLRLVPPPYFARAPLYYRHRCRVVPVT